MEEITREELRLIREILDKAEQGEQTALQLDEEVEEEHRKITRGTKRSLSPIEILIYCLWANATDSDFPNLQKKPSQTDMMRLFDRVGSEGSFQRWASETLGYDVTNIALQLIKLLMVKAVEK